MTSQKQNHGSIHQKLLNLVQAERRITSEILELLQEIENTRAYMGWGYAHLFDYLVKGLGYSESLAYQRKAALKICAVIPEVKEKLNNGSLSITTLARANKVLSTKTISKKRELLLELENKPAAVVDKILAREMPDLKSPGPAKRYVNENTIRITFDLSEEEFQKLEKLKALKSHQTTEIKTLFNILVEQDLGRYNKTSEALSKSNNPRQIKISLKNHLLKVADYKCEHKGCDQTHFLQIDHIHAVKSGGSNHPSNLQVLCSSHNRFKHAREQSVEGARSS